MKMLTIVSVRGNKKFAMMYVDAKLVQPVPHSVLEARCFGLLTVVPTSTTPSAFCLLLEPFSDVNTSYGTISSYPNQETKLTLIQISEMDFNDLEGQISKLL